MKKAEEVLNKFLDTKVEVMLQKESSVHKVYKLIKAHEEALKFADILNILKHALMFSLPLLYDTTTCKAVFGRNIGTSNRL